MSNRITMKDLESIVARINRVAGFPDGEITRTPVHTQTDEGVKVTSNFKWNIGAYTLSGAYGGWQLQQIVTDGGGIRCITHGYLPKREVYNQAQAFLAGMGARE